MSQPSSPLKEQPSPSGNQKKNPMSFLQSIFGKKRMRTQQDGSSTATHQSSCQTLPASNVTTTTAIKAQQPVLPIQRQPRGKHVIIIDDDDDEEDEEEEEEEEAKIEAVDQPPSRRQISLQPNGEDLPMDQSDNSSREFRLNSETPSTPTSTPFVASAKSHGSPSNESNANNDDDNAGATPKRRRILVEPMPNVGSLVRQELHEQQQATTTITMASPPQPEQRERLLNDSNSSVSTVTMPQHEEEHDHPLQHGSSATLEPMVNEQDPETSCDAHMMNDDDDNDDANNSVMSSTSVDSSDTHATDSTLPPPPLIEALKYQCWKCGVSFRQDNAFCFYVMHVHPVLEVPICFVCSRQVMAAAQEEDNEMTNTKVKPEQKQLFKSEEEESRDKETNDFCMGCGEDEEMVDVLFCCDKCPAKFCETCVAKAFGGGEEGVQRTHQLQQETEEWSCPKCQPPLPLEQLQQFVQGMTSSSYKENADGSTPNKKSSLQLHRRPREQVLDEYMKVEQERELVDWLLSPEQVAKKRIEIRNELLKKRGKLATGSSPNKKLSGELKKEEEEEEEDELEGQVESELQVWEQQMQDHDARLTDMSTTLQDEMGAMNVAIPYLAIPELEAKATSVADEPEWKKQADLECIQRQAKEKVAARRLTIPTYHDEVWDDVEDLRTSDLSDESAMEEDLERSQWRLQCRARKEDLDYATRCEDEQLKKRNIVVKRGVTDDQDALHIQNEEQIESTLGSDGVARVRRDDYQRWKGNTQNQSKYQQLSKPKANLPKATEAENGKKSRVWRLAPAQKRTPVSLKRTRERTSRDQEDDKAEQLSNKARKGLAPLFEESDDENFPLPSDDTADDEPALHDHEETGPNRPPKPTLKAKFDRKKARNPNSGRTIASPVVLDDTPPGSPTHDDDLSSLSSDTKDIFMGSTLVLSSDQSNPATSKARKRRPVIIAEPLARQLKPHQKEGVQFMWNNTFADLMHEDNQTDASYGCILAHNMGLGKTFSCISLLHCILNNPVLASTSRWKQKPIRTVLIVVPVNTIANWEAEFDNWTGNLHPSVRVINLGSVEKSARRRNIRKWTTKGGILLISDKTFLRAAKDFCEELVSPGPDVIVLDEAHVMVKNAETGIFKALSNVETHRRIGLTGSPIQNNLLEYYRMVSWIRPGLLGTEAEFEANYIIPITSGLPSDATQEAIRLSDEKSTELHEFLAPFVHRKDASVLKDEVPFMQQVILHIRPSKLQTQLYGAAKRFPDRNFFKLFQALKPVHNHPGCLLMKPSGQPAKVIIGNQAGPTKGQQTSHKGTNASKKDPPDDQEGIAAAHCCSLSTEGPRENGNNANANKCDVDNPVTSDSASALDNSVTTTKPLTSPENDTFDVEDDAAKMLHYAATNNEAEKWWMKIAQRVGLDEMKNINNGYKIVLFLHILVLAQRNGEKVMVFTKCCRTLDFIEEILNLEDWGAHVKSLRSELGEDKMGKWRKNVDYLRIDGQVGSSERGELVTKFNDLTQSADLFLISKAGGIGVNLVAASRVVLFDCDFNPTVNTQALFRCYRYGQIRPVFAYLFLTEGSMEEKIYSRCVTKTGMALRVVDKKTILRAFSARELNDLSVQDNWVQCDRCDKWRMLPPDDKGEDLPDRWYCEMNENDDINNNCDVSEKEATWYYRRGRFIGVDSPQKSVTEVKTDDVLPDSMKAKLIARDDILQKILHLSADKEKLTPSIKGKSTLIRRKGTSSMGKSLLISKYYFHEKLLEESGGVDEDLSLAKAGDGVEKKAAKSAPIRKKLDLDTKLAATAEKNRKSPEVPAAHDEPNSTNRKTRKSIQTATGSEDDSNGTYTPLKPNAFKADKKQTPNSVIVKDVLNSIAKKEKSVSTIELPSVASTEKDEKAKSRSVDKIIKAPPLSGRSATPSAKRILEFHQTTSNSTSDVIPENMKKIEKLGVVQSPSCRKRFTPARDAASKTSPLSKKEKGATPEVAMLDKSGSKAVAKSAANLSHQRTEAIAPSKKCPDHEMRSPEQPPNTKSLEVIDLMQSDEDDNEYFV